MLELEVAGRGGQVREPRPPPLAVAARRARPASSTPGCSSDVSYRPGLAPEERARYVEANRLAALFTARLLAHVVARRLDRLLEALRYAYRLGAEAKLQHLARAA